VTSGAEVGRPHPLARPASPDPLQGGLRSAARRGTPPNVLLRRRILAIVAAAAVIAGAAWAGSSAFARPIGKTVSDAGGVGLGLGLASLAPGSGADATSRSAAISAATLGKTVRHVVLIVLENHELGSIVGSADAPYFNSLVKRYGLAANYTGVAHPSEPNYLALFSGSTQGVTDDGVHSISAPNLADQLESHGLTWRVDAENVPLGCSGASIAYNGPDGSGVYARKHEPAISFTSIRANSRRCAQITNFQHFNLTAANFQLVVPNMCHDMHDCSVATGDQFLKSFVGPIIASTAFSQTLVFITFDEGSSSSGGGGKVATLVIGPHVASGYTSTLAHNHYSMLRTIENLWGLGCLAHSCSANDLHEFFR